MWEFTFANIRKRNASRKWNWLEKVINVDLTYRLIANNKSKQIEFPTRNKRIRITSLLLICHLIVLTFDSSLISFGNFLKDFLMLFIAHVESLKCIRCLLNWHFRLLLPSFQAIKVQMNHFQLINTTKWDNCVRRMVEHRWSPLGEQRNATIENFFSYRK